ncbi:MAG: FliA/WhiG family RNA polymerase sigma factor [Bdellovibrionales bacterium]|nr:FliA/WhiG family RNA polymerase sigma factor [Bdellovibrionales bacterium]
MSGDQNKQIVEEFLPLVNFVAKKIHFRLPAYIDLQDLIATGVVGLIDAVSKYDITKDNKFKTYAEFRIRGAILDELRVQDWVPRSIRDKAKLLNKAVNSLEKKLKRAPTDEEVSTEMGISKNEFYQLVNTVKPARVLSFDNMISFNTADYKSIVKLVEEAGLGGPDKDYNLKKIQAKIAEAISELSGRQKQILSMYYYKSLNLKEIGKILELTESRISQLHAQALLKLKAKLYRYFEKTSIAA